MGRQQQRQRTRVPLLGGLLALLLGLLTMHGLVGGHHGPAAAASSAGTAPLDGPAVGHGSDEGDGHAAVHDHATAVTTPHVADRAGGGCAACLDPGVAVLCLAVLSAGLALVLGRLSSRSADAPAPPAGLPLQRAGPPLLLRPPDPVAELCISRT